MAYKSNPGAYGQGTPADTEDYFSDSPESKGQERSVPDEQEEEGKHEETEGETAVLPKSILGGKEFNPGDEVVLKIVSMHDDSVEVEYAPEKGKGEGEEEMAEAPPPGGAGGAGGDAEMASMME